MTLDIEAIMEASAAFNGRFEFIAKHTEDNGLGLVADFVDVDNQLVFLSDGFEVGFDEHHVISDCIDAHVAKPLVVLLNAAPAMLAEISRLQKLVGEACGLASRLNVYPHVGVRSRQDFIARIAKEAGLP